MLACFKCQEMCNTGLESRVVGVSPSACWLQYTQDGATGRLAWHDEVSMLAYPMIDVSFSVINGHQLNNGWKMLVGQRKRWQAGSAY